MSFHKNLAIVAAGTAEEMGGGKFVNGAVTGAFVYLLSDMFDRNSFYRSPRAEYSVGRENTFIEPVFRVIKLRCSSIFAEMSVPARS